MEHKVNKIKVIVSIAVVVLLITLILVAVFVYNNREKTNQVVSENVSSENVTINENNTLIAEVEEPQEDSPWEWQYDTLENHNINSSVIENVHLCTF